MADRPLVVGDRVLIRLHGERAGIGDVAETAGDDGGGRRVRVGERWYGPGGRFTLSRATAEDEAIEAREQAKLHLRCLMPRATTSQLHAAIAAIQTQEVPDVD